MALGSLTTRLKTLLKSGTFARNVLTLMTGTTLAQAIPILAAPILTRIYTPADFGVLALFVAITSVLGAIATARYELAIMLPQDDEDALNLVALGVTIAITMSICMLVIVAVFNQQIAALLGNPDMAPWLYAAPLVVMLLGAYNALRYFNLRHKHFGTVAAATAYKAGGGTGVQLLLGTFVLGPAGLLIGHVFSHVAGNTSLLLNVLRQPGSTSSLSRTRAKGLASKYADFPKFSLWAVLANSLSHNLINVFISIIYTSATLGFYALVKRVLGTPTTLIGRAVGDVFFQRAAAEKRETGRAVQTFTGTLRLLLAIAVPFYALLYLISEPLFAFVFGEEWRVAGTYAKILAPLLGLQFVSSPLSTVSAVFEKQRISLLWQLGLLVLTIGIFALASYTSMPVATFLVTYSTVISAYYLFKLWLSYAISRGLL